MNEIDTISTDPALFMVGHVHLPLLNKPLSCSHLALDSVVADFDQETKHR